MNIPISNPRSELQLAINAALKAGEAVLEVYSKEFTTETKSDKSPITEADIKSNQIIKDVLNQSGYSILSEEDKDDKVRLEQDFVWIIDPLDGTTDFVKKTGEFTIMIALVEKTIPTIGVIYWPTEKTMFVAQKNAGAFKSSGDIWEKIQVTKETELENCRAIGSRNHLTEEEKSLFEKLKVKEFKSIGSSLKVGKVSSGEAEIYITTTDKMKEWDTCASFCIITEAGGKMTDNSGNVLTYNNEKVNHLNGIVATNGIIHDKIIENMKKLK